MAMVMSDGTVLSSRVAVALYGTYAVPLIQLGVFLWRSYARTSEMMPMIVRQLLSSRSLMRFPRALFPGQYRLAVSAVTMATGGPGISASVNPRPDRSGTP